MPLRSEILAALLLMALAAPAAAQECGGDFEAWKQGVAAEAKAAGVGAVGLDALEDATIDDKVLARDRAQGVFTQTFIEFSNRMIAPYRLKQGAANLKKYADVFARADQEFGVQAPVMETPKGFQFAGESQCRALFEIHQRFFSHPIASQVQEVLLPVPKSEGKHSNKVFESSFHTPV